jgi:hypothetical protein
VRRAGSVWYEAILGIGVSVWMQRTSAFTISSALFELEEEDMLCVLFSSAFLWFGKDPV